MGIPPRVYPVVGLYGRTVAVDLLAKPEQNNTETEEVLECNDVAKLLPLAARFELPKLLERCAEVLLRDLTAENIVERVRVLSDHAEHPLVQPLWDGLLRRLAGAD